MLHLILMTSGVGRLAPRASRLKGMGVARGCKIFSIPITRDSIKKVPVTLIRWGFWHFFGVMDGVARCRTNGSIQWKIKWPKKLQ
jgi:hypothetical protein